ncbi:MAG: lipoprotein-releasing ABC transporter ATP-binding protein LolD [Gammaproteobacteria bacterium]|nr:lipoprotein-releasing ABC transporter ATP-binding protein LolD [Gammaproteobacteria bacterium]
MSENEPMSAAVIEAVDVCKRFRQGKLDVEVLRGVNFRVSRGESHAILGASGAGKSTLMHLLGGLDHVSSGHVRVAGNELARLGEADLGRLRNRHLGFIYQFHHLLPEFSALENIALPLLVRRTARTQAHAAAREWLLRVGLEARLEHKPGELSGGERQRVALARALVTQPDCLLADEPTGNLDRKTAAQMLDLMLELNRELDTALVVVTHDLEIAARMAHRWHMSDGVLTHED